MLKKIKKYKINVRPSYVVRNLKRKLNLPSVADDLEKNIQEQINKVQPLIVPSAVYNTFSRKELPQSLYPLWGLTSNSSLSISFTAVTIGSGIEKEIQTYKNQNQETQVAILDSIARESLEQAQNFVVKLLTEEAKSEGCELSVLSPVDLLDLKDILGLLEASKTEVNLNADNQIVPLFTSVSYCFWNPTSKSRSARAA